jgi:hypothetical protein
MPDLRRLVQHDAIVDNALHRGATIKDFGPADQYWRRDRTRHGLRPSAGIVAPARGRDQLDQS